MEIEQTARTTDSGEGKPQAVKPGSLVRVRVLKQIKGSSHLVEFRGNTHLARLEGRIPSRLFIARVVRLDPKMVLKYIRTFETGTNTRGMMGSRTVPVPKKSFIQDLITTDNFFEKLLVPLQKSKKGIKESLHRAVRNQNIFRLLGKHGTISKEIITYYCLQNIYNLLNYDTSALWFPLMIGEKYSPCDLRVFRAEGGHENSFLLTVSLENERKIAFLVFIDYEIINCTISTNSSEIEGRVRSNIRTLIQNLKGMKLNREVKVRITRYDESDLLKLGNMKKIDIRL